MKPNELKELLDTVSEKVRRETIKEIVEFVESYLCWDEECLVSELKMIYADELKELEDENN